MIGRVLILDCETSGIDPLTDRILEIGAVLWDVSTICILECYSALIHDPADPSNAAEATNRIAPSALQRGRPLEEVNRRLAELVDRADVATAWNAKFDAAFLTDRVPIPWICAMDDLQYPRSSSSKSLIATALAHGLGVADAHRALTDCLLLARLFERVAEGDADLQAFFERGLRPKLLFQALVPKPGAQAKAAGFRWNEDGSFRWLRAMPPEDAARLPFPTKEASVASPSSLGPQAPSGVAVGRWVPGPAPPSHWVACPCPTTAPYSADLLTGLCAVCGVRGFRPLPLPA